MYSVDTTIRGASRGSADAFYAWAKQKGAERLPDVRLFLDTIYDIAPKIGMRAELCVGQSIHETTDVDSGAPWASYWWIKRANPAGAGVTGDPKEDAVSPTFASGKAAALYQLTHLWAYAVGTSLPKELKQSDDPRWQNVIDAGYVGTAPTLGGLNGKWAVDPDRYGQKISARLNALESAGLLSGNAIFPGIPDQSDTPVKDTTVSDTIDKAIDITSNAIKNAQKPYVLVTAGHRSDGDAGDPTEKSLTGFMAEEYVKQLRAAGYEADWWQRDLDGDSNPTMTSPGGLDNVALGCGRVLAARKDALSIMLDCHYNGPHSPMHAIVPDVVGLHTAYAGGAPSDDTAANNTEDVKVGMAIAREIIAATGLSTFKGMLGLAGIMSERETGVALQYDARLAMFAATAGSRAKAVRLVIEHGGYKDTPATRDDFTGKCAGAVVKALNGIYGTSAPSKPVDPPIVVPPVVVKPSPVVYPPNITREIAAIFFGKVKGNDGREYGYDENGPVSQMWLADGKRTGTFPHLVTATVIGTAKYFAFSDGLILFQPSSKEVIRQYSAA